MGVLKVLICGKGVTGFATGTAWAEAGAEVDWVDPIKAQTGDALGYTGVQDRRYDIALICVPTPAGNLNYVRDAVKEAVRLSDVVLVRSTVPPGAIDSLNSLYGDGYQVGLFPEFLREEYAVEDARKKDRFFYAIDDDERANKIIQWAKELGYAQGRRCRLQALELLKVSLNSMLAVKVFMANLLYDLAGSQVAYDELVELMMADGWVSKFGMQVPGRHGRGFSGTCLPKDLAWLAQTLQKHQGGDEAESARTTDASEVLYQINLINGRLLLVEAEKREVVK